MVLLYPIGVPRFMFLSMYIHRGFLYKLMAEQGNLQGDEKARRKSLLENKSIFHNGKQRRSSWDASFSKVGWLTENQLKNFQPSCWWMYVVLFHFIHARTTTNCANGLLYQGGLYPCREGIADKPHGIVQSTDCASELR